MGETTKVSLAPKPPTQPLRKAIPKESLNYVRSIVSTIVKVEGDTLNQSVLTPIYILLMGSEQSDYIRDPAAIWILLELLPYLNHALQVEVWQKLISIVGRSLRNLQVCCTLDLVPLCLDLISQCTAEKDTVLGERIAEFIGTISTYDLSVEELKMFLSALSATPEGKWPTQSKQLLSAMRMMPKRSVPEIMFNFTGELGSAITIPPITRWPSNPGFTLNLWVSFDPRFMFPAYKPFLYWFKTGKGLGYSAMVTNQQLLLETVTGKGQITGKMTKTPSKVEKRLDPHTWYMISVVYVYHRLKSCEVICFINGRQVHRQDVGFVNTSEPFDKCYIGSSPRATVETSFCGQMSGVTMFSDCLNGPTVNALYRLGPGYKHAFQYRNEHDVPIPAADANLVYNGKLANSTVFSYNPKACNGQLSFEVAQNPLQDFFVNSSHAILLEGVETVATRSVQSALHSLGGIQVLLPLFEQLTTCTDSTPELCSTLLWLFVDLVRSSAACQSFVVTHRTLAVIGHLLHRVDRGFLGEAALDALLTLGRTLVDIKQGALLNSLISDILLRTEMWIRTPVKVQVKLYSALSTEFVGGSDGIDVRPSLTVGKVFAILCDYYWIQPESEQDSGTDRILTSDDVTSLRAFLILTAKQCLMRSRVPAEDLSSILSYLITNKHAAHLMDVLHLLLALMSEHSAAIVPVFEELGGVNVLFHLLRHPTENVRLYAVKTLGSYLNSCTPKTSSRLISKSSIFTVLAEYLSPQPLTRATYNVLCELTLAHMSRQVVSERFFDPDPDARIKYPQLLEVIAVLLLKRGPEDEDRMEYLAVAKQYLTTLLLLLQRSRDNRRVLISQNGWQRWMVGLMLHWSDCGGEGQHVTDIAYSLFQTLLHHALQWEQDGWLVWVETLSILHAYQSDGLGVVSTEQEQPQQQPSDQYDSCRADDEASFSSEQHPKQVVPDIYVEPETPRPTSEAEISEDGEGEEIPQEGASEGEDIPEEAQGEEEESATSEEEEEELCQEVDKEEEEEVPSQEEIPQEPEILEVSTVNRDEYEDLDATDGEEEDEVEEQKEEPIEKEEAVSEEQVEVKINGGLSSEGEEEEGKELPSRDEEVKEDDLKKRVSSSDSGVEEEGDDVDDVDEKEVKSPEIITETEDIAPKIPEEGTKQEDLEEVAQEATEKVEEPETIEDSPTVTVEETSEDAGTKTVEEHQAEADEEPHSVDVSETEAAVEPTEDTATEEVVTEDKDQTAEEEEEVIKEEAVEKEEEVSAGDEEEATAAASTTEDENSMASSSEPRLEHQCTPVPEPRVSDELPVDLRGESCELRVPPEEEGSESATSDILLEQGNVIITPNSLAPTIDDSEEESPATTTTTGPTHTQQRSKTEPWSGYPFHPGQWRFASMPKFSWSLQHQRLLSDLLVALSTTMKLWKSGQRSASEMVNARDNSVYMTNVAHIISLTADNLVVESGGVGKLVNEITVPGKPSQETYEPVMEFEKAHHLISLLVGIVDTVVFSSVLNFHPVEAARSLKQGGMLRIALRLVTCLSTINCLNKRRSRFSSTSPELVLPVLQEEINSKLTPLGIVGEPLRIHLLNKLEVRHAEERRTDHLLEESDIYHLRCCVMRDLDLYMKESEQQALNVLFYLSVLTVTQYHEIVNRQRGGSATITDQVERSLTHVGPLLHDLLLDFQGFFAKTITGTHGREIFNDSFALYKNHSLSVVELAMQLCSQEWLTALERHAGVSFTKLLREGRHVAASTDEYLVKLALWSEGVAAEAIAEHIVRAAEFDTASQHTVSALLAEHTTVSKLLASQQRQALATGEQSWRGVQEFLQQIARARDDILFYRLDSWEDSSRRRYKLVYNPSGSSHDEATLHPSEAPVTASPASTEPVVVGGLTKRPGGPDPEEEGMMEEAVAVDESDSEDRGSILFCERASILLPGSELTGTLTITSTVTIFNSPKEGPTAEEFSVKFYNVDVSAVFTRRYLHVYRALEIFTIGHRSSLLVLADYEAVKRAVSALPRVGVGLQYGLPCRRNVSLAHPKRLLRESNMMDRWRRREVSNFDYLMFLNTIAGRSYNDLGQYPVMPWVLRNYTSDTLDLADPSNYRDLGKPIGAQSDARADKFREKFEMSKEGVAPPFHYGTHYSTPGFVMMWLLRVEPFTSDFLKLQSGKFDHPCRIFSSIAQAWENCQRDMSDVKELIPELFYLPEMFVNNNGYNLGVDDDGRTVSNVLLPPWAHNHHHFLQVHRDALESEYVSSNLHKWIDLIFGAEQRAEPSRCNTFYYTTYEGQCDPSTVDDPVIREALEQQIKSFGQTPPQLLTAPHPARNSLQHLLNCNVKNLNGVLSALTPVNDEKVVLIAPLTTPSLHSTPQLLSVAANQTVATSKFAPSSQNPYTVFIESDGAPRQIKDPTDPTLSSLPSSYAISPDGKILFCVGFWDSSFKSFSTETGRQIQSMFGHRDLVTCISVTGANMSLYVPHTRISDGIVATGSRDATVCVWDWNGRARQITGVDGRHAAPRSILTGHHGTVECVSVSGEQGVVVSAARDSPILLHRVTGELIRKIRVPSTFSVPGHVLVTRRCEIVAHYTNNSGYLSVFSANGDILRTQELQEQVLTMISDQEGDFLITGGFNLTPTVRSIATLSPVLRLSPCQSALNTLALSDDQRFLITGLANGTINVYPIDFRRIVNV